MKIIFNTDFAEKHGLNEAIMVSILDTLIQEEGIECEGAKWVVLSYEKLKELIPFMSCTTIRRTIYNLEKQGVIKTKTARSRKWYTLNIAVQNGQGYQTSGKAPAQNGQIDNNKEPVQNEQEKDFDKNPGQNERDNQDSDKRPVQNEQETNQDAVPNDQFNPVQTDHDQNGQPQETLEIQAFSQAVQNEHPNNNCRKINYYDQDNLKPDPDNFIYETTTNISNTLDQEAAVQNGQGTVQNRLSLREIKNLLSDYDIEISWNKRAWQALKQLAALTRDEILKLAKRLFSLQCEGVIKNPAGLLVAKPAEIIQAFFTGTLYPSHTAEYERSEYFPLCVYAVS